MATYGAGFTLTHQLRASVRYPYAICIRNAEPAEEQLRLIRCAISFQQQLQLVERHFRVQIYTLTVLRDNSDALENY